MTAVPCTLKALAHALGIQSGRRGMDFQTVYDGSTRTDRERYSKAKLWVDALLDPANTGPATDGFLVSLLSMTLQWLLPVLNFASRMSGVQAAFTQQYMTPLSIACAHTYARSSSSVWIVLFSHLLDLPIGSLWSRTESAEVSRVFVQIIEGAGLDDVLPDELYHPVSLTA